MIAAVAAASNVRAIGNEDGTESVLEPLFDVVDPDALDALFDPGAPGAPRMDGEVTFTHHGHDGRVRSDGRIVVERAKSGGDEVPAR